MRMARLIFWRVATSMSNSKSPGQPRSNGQGGGSHGQRYSDRELFPRIYKSTVNSHYELIRGYHSCRKRIPHETESKI